MLAICISETYNEAAFLEPAQSGGEAPVMSASDSVDDWVDEAADRFERAWRTGSAPRIADFVQGEVGKRRNALLLELVRIDLDYRRQAGLRCDLQDYVNQFPELVSPGRTGPTQSHPVDGDPTRQTQRVYHRRAGRATHSVGR